MGRGLTRYLPQVALATFAVAGLPALISSAVQATVGVPAGLAILMAMLLSVLFARAGAAIWMRRPDSRDIVFGDLMAWGWLRRVRAERRLAEAERLLGRGKLPAGRRVELLKGLAADLEARDSYTHGHSNRVARLSEAIARNMGLSREQVAKVRTAAAVHDVGKIKTPREILTKPGKLTDPEQAVMQRHVSDGAEMVSALGDPEITAMVEGHHERLDGSGYPEAVPAEGISVGARIIAVADTFDAMTSARPYRSALKHKRAMDTLAAESGARLDPRAVAAFNNHYSGERAVPLSAFLTTAPQRLASWAAGVVQEGALPLTQGISALGTAALLGGSMIGTAANADSASSASADAVTAASVAAATGAAPSARLNARRAGGGPGSRPLRRPAPRRRSRADNPGAGGQTPGTNGSPAAPQQGSGPTGPQDSTPGSPSKPPSSGGGAQQTVTVTPHKLEVGTNVTVPLLPSTSVDLGVKGELPTVELPKVGLPKVGLPKTELPKLHIQLPLR
jgi:putative nucleotidyltransferase with HDIG domain